LLGIFFLGVLECLQLQIDHQKSLYSKYRKQKSHNLNSQLLQSKISNTLRIIGSEPCIAEAIRVESLTTLKRRFHFRNLGLSIENLKAILDLLTQENNYTINSISFSHNPIGDEGAIIIAESLDYSIEEIGLVDCGISDIGGRAILSTLHQLPALDMVCIEQNNLSKNLKLEYQKFGAFNPELMVIV